MYPQYPTLPNIQVNQPYTPVQTNVPQGTELSNMLDKITSMMKPQQQFQNYDQYAAPQRAVFSNFVNTNMIPEFNQNTYNPAVHKIDNNMAANYGTGAVMGNALQNYNQFTGGLKTQLADQVGNAQNSYEAMIRGLYNNSMHDYYNAPSSFNNIGM